MAKGRCTADEIIGKLSEAEVPIARGLDGERQLGRADPVPRAAVTRRRLMRPSFKQGRTLIQPGEKT